MELNLTIQKYEEIGLKLLELEKKYQRPTVDLENQLNEMKKFKVTLPLVGAFSSGKSSLINALLSEKLLPVKLDPLTAVPTEIYYSPADSIHACANNQSKEITREDLRSNPFHVNQVDVIKAGISNPWLSTIKNIKIVDLPGLESEIAAHDKAIDNYLLYSMAYIIVVSAEDGTVRNSVLQFLKELHLFDMDVFVVITKADKKDVMEEGIYEEVQTVITKTLGLNDIEIGIASSRKNEVDDVKKFLTRIQQKAPAVFIRHFREPMTAEFAQLERYLHICLDKEDVSLDDINREEERQKVQLQEVQEKIEREKSLFMNQVDGCVHSIKERIRSNLTGIGDLLVQDIQSNMDSKTRIQQVVRTSILEGIKNEFEPKLQKYLKNIQEMIPNDFVFNTDFKVNQNAIKMDDMLKDTVIKSIPIIMASIGLVIAGPVGAIISGAVTVLVEMFFTNRQQERELETIREKVYNDLIPSVTQSAGDEFSFSIRNSIEKINAEIEEKLEKQQIATLEGLEKLRAQKQTLETEQQQLKKEIQQDLEELSNIGTALEFS